MPARRPDPFPDPIPQPLPQPAPLTTPPTTEPVTEPATEAPPLRRLPGWRLWVPLLFQMGLIVAVPAQDAYTYVTGRQVTLQTAPVDPYDLLRGHYQVLSYEISRVDQLQSLPGGNELNQSDGRARTFYLILEAPAQTTTPPQPWKPVRVSRERPQPLAENQVALQGQLQWGSITYGLETYYMPEAQRDRLNQDIAQQQDRQAFVVDVKVDRQGNAVPVSLWVRERNYRF